MRKILSLVLVLSLVLGSFSFAFAAPADVEGTDYEDAVTRLSALEILSGFPDGTFRPNETITRAQFAKIMVTALGVGEAAKYAAGETKFVDVPANHWAAGYINVASDMGIINGYGDGNFGPEDQVTYAQAVTMIVRGLGYEPKAQAMGGYPGGYLAVAAEKEITEDITIVDTLAATRGDVALMVDASLDVPMMVQKTWGQFPEYEEDETKTLLTSKLGVDEIKGRVTAVPNVDSSLDEDEITIGSKDYTLLTDVNLDSLLGLEVKVWADGSDVFFVEVDTDEDAIYFDTVTASTKDDVTLYVEDDTFDWAKDAEAYVNFKEVKDLDKIPADSYGYFVMNDDDEVVFANVFDFTELYGVVYEIDEDEIKFVDNSGNKDEFEYDDYKDGVFVYNDKFELIDTDAVDVNSAIFAWETSDELYLVVKNEVVEGTLERIKDSEIKVDGTDYDAAYNGAVYSDDAFDTFSIYNDVTDLDNLGDEEVTVVFDLNDEILLVYGDPETTSGTMYGIVTYGNVGSKAEVTVFNKDGEEVDYVFESRTDGLGLEHDGYYELLGNNDAKNLSFAAIKFELNSDGEIDSNFDPANDITNITYSDDDSSDGITVPSGDGTLSKSADKTYVLIDGTTRYYIDEDTIFMTALGTTSTANVYELDPSVIAYEDIYESEISGQNVVFYADSADRELEFVVFLDPQFTGADDDVYYGVVTDSPWKDGSDYVAKIDVFGEGEDEYVVANKDDFKEGSVVAFKINTDNEIEKFAGGTGTKAEYKNELAANLGQYDYDSGYATFNTIEERVASGAVLYALDIYTQEDGSIDISKGVNGVKGIDEKIKATDLDDYNNVYYVLDGDGILVAAVVYKEEVSTPEVKWALTLTDEVDSTSAGIKVDITKPADVADFTAHSVALYEGDTLKSIKAAAASVNFGTDDGIEKAKIYTVKVLLTEDLSVVVEKDVANIK